MVWAGEYSGLQSKKFPPSPLSCFVGQPLVQQEAPPSQHCPLQPDAGPAAQWQAPEMHVPPAQGMQVLLQTISPVAQAQLPLAHVALDGQVVEQLPQWFGSVARFTQALPQVVGSDAGHWQTLLEQISFVSGQAFPQLPQFDGSFVVFTQAVGVPAGHCVGSDVGHSQVPPEQISFASGQACPQPPAPAQFLASVWVFAQNVPQSSGLVPPHWHAPV